MCCFHYVCVCSVCVLLIGGCGLDEAVSRRVGGGNRVCVSGFCGLITEKVSDGEYYLFYELNGAEGQEFHCLLLN